MTSTRDCNADEARKRADRSRGLEADFLARGNREQAQRFGRLAHAWDDAAHLLDLDPDASFDIAAILAARDDGQVRSLSELRESTLGPAYPVVTGAEFILDTDTKIAARWGSTTDIVWPTGEPFLMVGPPGVGKTTVAVQIVGGLLGIVDGVLGLPVMQARRVLYFALDRPRQIQRAMARLFGAEHRGPLEHLSVWKGPLPADLGKHPALLLNIAREYGADVIVVDSLKDCTAKLSDDESGSNLNRALQLCVADGIDVLGLHHQRKGQNGTKPKTLEDVYGSTWITAGAGSVVLLWGEAGSELVEFEHLKQPADPVGPWKIEHDHHAGTSAVSHGFDVVRFLTLRKKGATLDEIAKAEWASTPTPAQRKKTERRVRKLLRTVPPMLHAVETEADDGRFAPIVYVAATVDTDRGHAPNDEEAPPIGDNRGPLAVGPWTDLGDNRGHLDRGHGEVALDTTRVPEAEHVEVVA